MCKKNAANTRIQTHKILTYHLLAWSPATTLTLFLHLFLQLVAINLRGP